MRCYYMSDLHLESQEFSWHLPEGDVLIIAGDLCQARCLVPDITDLYGINQRARVWRLLDEARAKFTHILFVAGNHEYYDGIYEETIPLLKGQLDGVTVLDNEHIDIDGVRFFGGTLWSDFEGHSQACMDSVRRGLGDYFFIKTHGAKGLRKFQPEDALAAFDRSLATLKQCVIDVAGQRLVLITHHAPSLKGLNPMFVGNGLDGAFASNLDELIASFENVAALVHGHTHIRRIYRIGDTTVRTNCRGYDKSDDSARSFRPDTYFEV